ncbi:MAG: phosphonate C-P lyase system protein PhnG [Hyphomicrobiales bacterium]
MDRFSTPAETERAAAMRLFALAPWGLLEAETRALAKKAHSVLRGPETGLVMVRGRMGATGSAFNLGEATVTRCTVRLESGTEGHAYVQGRNAEHARRAALCDALFQESKDIVTPVLKAINTRLKAGHLDAAAKAAATRVDFFTLVRGDD